MYNIEKFIENYLSFSINLFFLGLYLSFTYGGFKYFHVLIFLVSLVNLFLIYYAGRPLNKRHLISFWVILFLYFLTTLFSGIFFLDKSIIIFISLSYFLTFQYLLRENYRFGIIDFLSIYLILIHISYQLLYLNDVDYMISTSRNGISIFLVLVFSYFLVLSKRPILNLVLTLLIVYLSSITMSRSAMISSLFLLIGCYFYLAQSGKVSHKLWLIVFSTLIAIVFINTIDFSTIEIVSRFEKRSFGDVGREAVIGCYTEHFSSSKLLFGLEAFNGHNCGFLAIGTYNTHNSYIQLFSRFGPLVYIYFIFVFFAILKSINSKNFFLILCMLSISTRILTDDIAFVGYLDWWVVSLFTLGFFYSKKQYHA